MGSTQSRGFAIAVFIISAVLVGVLLACIIYFNNIRNGKIPTPGEATSMLIICGILFAVTLGLFIWALVALFISSDTREAAVNTVTTKTTNFLGATSYGYTPSELGFRPPVQAQPGAVTTITERRPVGAAVAPVPGATVTTVTEKRPVVVAAAPAPPKVTTTKTVTTQQTTVARNPFQIAADIS